MATFWSGFDHASPPGADTQPPDDPKALISVWRSGQDSSVTSDVSNPSRATGPVKPIPTISKPAIAGSKPRKRLRDAINPRTKVACTACYQSKSCCDQARPCGRCVRLNRPDDCRDRVHKKRTVSTSHRALPSVHRPVPTSRVQIPHQVSNVIDIPPSKMSVEAMAQLFSKTLAEMWLHQCQSMIGESLMLGDAIYNQTIQRIIHVTDTHMRGLIVAPVFEEIRHRLSNVGIHVSGFASPIVRPPFDLIQAAEANESEAAHSKDDLKVAVIKSVQLPSMLRSETPRRGLYINAEATRLFGYTPQELCDMFNRTSPDHAFTPFWTWIIDRSDWVNVIRHNSLFFLSQEEPAAAARASSESPRASTPDDGNHLVVTCIDQMGRPRKCLAGTRSSPTPPRSYGFCFFPLNAE